MENTIEILKSILNSYRIKKNELAKALDVSPQYITKIFNGSRKFTLKNVEMLTKSFNLKEDDIIELKKSIVFSKTDENMKKWIDDLEDDAYRFKSISRDSDISEIIDLVYKIKNSETRIEILSFILFKLEEEKRKEDNEKNPK